MKAILLLMLAVEAAIILVTIYSVVWAKPSPERRRPIWSSLAFALIIIGATGWRIADSHSGQQGADIVGFLAPLLLGMGIFSALVLLRERRGTPAT
jgi:hypothetical protein